MEPRERLYESPFTDLTPRGPIDGLWNSRAHLQEPVSGLEFRE
jgi:hypothetical protein